KVLNAILIRGDFFQTHQVFAGIRAIDEANWNIQQLIIGQRFHNGHHWCQAGAASQQQHWLQWLAQEEGTHRSFKLQLVADLRDVFQPVGHQTIRGVFDEEPDLLHLWAGGKGVGTGLSGARDGDVDVLSRQEVQTLAVFYFQLQLKDGVRQGAHLGDLSTEGFRTGLSQYGGGANLQDHIGAWLGLAWQAET